MASHPIPIRLLRLTLPGLTVLVLAGALLLAMSFLPTHTPVALAQEVAPSGGTAGPSINLSKTVGISSSTCAQTSEITVAQGTPVFYCFTVTNTGDVTFTSHTLVDTDLGTILNAFTYSLAPGASAFITATTTPDVSVTNVATWTSQLPVNAAGLAPSATAVATATVNVQAPLSEIAVIKTVGLDPSTCAPESSLLVEAGTTVYYCFTVINLGQNTLVDHTVEDSLLGPIVTDLEADVLPGGSFSITRSHTAELSASNTVTWSTFTSAESTETGTASANVEVGVATIEIEKLIATADSCDGLPSASVPENSSIWYCITIRNTGDFTFTQHQVSDPQLGIDTTLDYVLAPGATVFVTNDQIASLGPIVVSAAITNTVVVTSSSPGEVSLPTQVRAAAVAPTSATAAGVSRITLQVPTADDETDEPGLWRSFLPLMVK